MATLTEVRLAVAEALSGLLEEQVSAYMLADPTPPTAQLIPGRMDYHQAFQNGLEFWIFYLQVFVSDDAGDIGAQEVLDRYLGNGERSVKNLIEADPTLGGIIDDVTVTATDGYRRYVTPSRPVVLGAEWTLRVLAS